MSVFVFIKRIFLIGLMLVSTSCINQSADETISLNEETSTVQLRPEFIQNIHYYDDLSRHCIDIWQRPLWETGTDAQELTNQLMSSIEIVIDNTSVPRNKLIILVADALYPVFNDEDIAIGSYGGVISACFADVDLEAGSHTAMINMVDLSGMNHSYTWTFNAFP